jgi:pyruvate dehydrogenase E2 component (dihydrolipoamide acetyltransferase)
MAREAGLDLGVVNGSGPGGRIVAKDVAKVLSAQAPAPLVEVKATPVATNLAAALGLDLSSMTGSGPQGRVTQQDVLEAAAAIIRQKTTVLRQAQDAVPEPGLPKVASTVPLKGVRKIVSEGMATSVRTTARVTLFREVDVTEFVKLRERFKSQVERVSYNDILVQICAMALREHPEANARLGDGGHPSDGWIERMDRINIGLAVDTERGLLVPVIHNADRLTIAQIATERARLIEATRTGRSLPDDLVGGTFTITNLGMFGVEGFTPVINLPECCILGVGRIVRKPTVIDEDDTVVVRPMMTLSLVFDHRVVDGAPAARFLDRIAQLVKDPMLLLIKAK